MSNSHDINSPGIDIWSCGFRLRRGKNTVTDEQVHAIYKSLTETGYIENEFGEWHLASSLCAAFEFCIDTRKTALARMILIRAAHAWLADRYEPELAGMFYGLGMSTLPSIRIVLTGEAGGDPLDTALKKEFTEIIKLADKELPLVPVSMRRIHLVTTEPNSK
jgi:hypothetical protein